LFQILPDRVTYHDYGNTGKDRQLNAMGDMNNFIYEGSGGFSGVGGGGHHMGMGGLSRGMSMPPVYGAGLSKSQYTYSEVDESEIASQYQRGFPGGQRRSGWGQPPMNDPHPMGGGPAGESEIGLINVSGSRRNSLRGPQSIGKQASETRSRAEDRGSRRPATSQPPMHRGGDFEDDRASRRNQQSEVNSTYKDDESHYSESKPAWLQGEPKPLPKF